MTSRNIGITLTLISLLVLFSIHTILSIFIDRINQPILYRNFEFCFFFLSLAGVCTGLAILYRTLALRGRGIFLINISFIVLFIGAVSIPNIIDRRNPPGFGLGQFLALTLLFIFLAGICRGALLIYRSFRKSP